MAVPFETFLGKNELHAGNNVLFNSNELCDVGIYEFSSSKLPLFPLCFIDVT